MTEDVELGIHIDGHLTVAFNHEHWDCMLDSKGSNGLDYFTILVPELLQPVPRVCHVLRDVLVVKIAHGIVFHATHDSLE